MYSSEKSTHIVLLAKTNNHRITLAHYHTTEPRKDSQTGSCLGLFLYKTGAPGSYCVTKKTLGA